LHESIPAPIKALLAQQKCSSLRQLKKELALKKSSFANNPIGEAFNYNSNIDSISHKKQCSSLGYYECNNSDQNKKRLTSHYEPSYSYLTNKQLVISSDDVIASVV
jgi:hypothetical protein